LRSSVGIGPSEIRVEKRGDSRLFVFRGGLDKFTVSLQNRLLIASGNGAPDIRRSQQDAERDPYGKHTRDEASHGFQSLPGIRFLVYTWKRGRMNVQPLPEFHPRKATRR
jgi:hypothetical protein